REVRGVAERAPPCARRAAGAGGAELDPLAADRLGQAEGCGMTDIAAQATGRWPAILAALGVDERILSRKHSPCPVCGGRDRFRFTDYQQRGMWICNQCGTGDGFDLLQRIHGWSFSEAAEQIKPL